jgi:hypothetical protein
VHVAHVRPSQEEVKEHDGELAADTRSDLFAADGKDDRASHQRSRKKSCSLHHTARTSVIRCVDRSASQHSYLAEAPRQLAKAQLASLDPSSLGETTEDTCSELAAAVGAALRVVDNVCLSVHLDFETVVTCCDLLCCRRTERLVKERL